MAEEVAALKTKISHFEDQQEQAHDLLKTLQAATQKQDTPGAQATPPQQETRQLVVVHTYIHTYFIDFPQGGFSKTILTHILKEP